MSPLGKWKVQIWARSDGNYRVSLLRWVEESDDEFDDGEE
jgi:hypothetical protein